MTLVLTIENEQSLPNGAPVTVRLTGKRGIDIGRAAQSDWPLPDPSRFISGRHCEVRFREDAYWLNDLSTNGTFLNDSARRIQTPHRLRHGDRLAIGSYVIAVAIEGADGDGESPLPAGAETAEAAALSPIEIAEGVRLDADIAQAIASETAPTPGSSAERESQSDQPGLGAQGEAQGEAPGAAGTLDPAMRRDGPPTTRPHTMVRARGFGAAARGIGDDSPNPAPPPAPERAREEAALNPHEEEARAWSAQGRAADRQGAEAEPVPAQAAAPGAEDFLRRFAKGAGVPDHIFARQDALKVAEDLGALMRLTVEDLTQLLNARFKAKRFARASSQTMIQALDNNPLKFAPTASDALKIMFGPRTSGYLDARRALEGAFTDLKTHQVMTFAAMQQAVRMLVEDLDPQAIADSAGEDKGLAALFGTHKARLWDLFVARWQAKTLRHEDGLVDAFMLYFAQCYDQSKESK